MSEQQRSLFTTEPEPPIAGTWSSTRQASASGARAVVQTWSHRQSVVLQLLAGGPKCRQELVGLSGLPINSICSVVGALLKRKEIERTGDCDVHVDGNGKVTERERFRIRRAR